MIRSIIVYPFISCFAWSLLSGFLYLFSGENTTFSGYWGIAFLSLIPLLLSIIVYFFIHKNLMMEVYITKLIFEKKFISLFFFLWMFYILIFTLSFMIQYPCFHYIYDCPFIDSLQFPIFTIRVHFFTFLFFFLKKML